MKKLFDTIEIEKRIRAWADVTMLSLELKYSMMRKMHPGLSEDEIRSLMRKEISDLRVEQGK
jgi:hypothetical protein